MIYRPFFTNHIFDELEQEKRDIRSMQQPMEQIEEFKQTKLIEGIIDGKTGALAAKDAGYGVSAQRTPYKLVPPEELRRRFQEIAHRKGLTMDRIGDKIAEHLDARANQTLEGKQVTQSEAPDYKIQQKALDQLTTLIGLTERAAGANGTSSVTLSISGPAADRLASLLSGE